MPAATLLGALADLSLAGCRAPAAAGSDAGAPAATARSTASSDGAAPTPAEGDAGARPADPRALLLARGTLHGELVPILLSPPLRRKGGGQTDFFEGTDPKAMTGYVETTDRIPAWLGFLGDAETARAPWAAVACTGPGESCGAWSFLEGQLEWPVGVRVVGQRVDEEHRTVFVRVRTLALLGQPAGLDGVVVIPMPGHYPAETGDTYDWPLRLAGVGSDEELSRRLDLLRKGGVSWSSDEERTRLQALFDKAGASAAALSRAVDPAGLDVESIWQGRFPERLAHLRREEVPRAPHLERLLTMVREASTSCSWAASLDPARPAQPQGICGNSDGFLVVRRRPEGLGIEAIALPPLPAAPTTLAPGVPIPSRPASPATRRTARELWSSIRILAEAPWSRAGGTIAVAEAPPEAPKQPAKLLLLTVEGSYARAQTLFLPSFGAGDTTVEIAFADVDGDGRADVVVKIDPAPEAASAIRVFLSPRDAQAASEGQLVPDEAVAPFLPDATSLDDAVRRALDAPRGTVEPEAARAALAAHRLARGARAFHVAESGALVALPLPKIRHLLPGCTDPGGWALAFSCDPLRPICHAFCGSVSPGSSRIGFGEPGTYFTYVLDPAHSPLGVAALVTDRWYGEASPLP